MMKAKWTLWTVVLLCALVLTACGSSAGGNEQPESNPNPNPGVNEATPPENKNPSEVATIDTKPVSLTIFNSNYANADAFREQFVDPVTKKYPFISMEIISNSADSRIETLVATGSTPDLVQGAGPAFANTLTELDYPAVLDPYIKKYQFDLAKFNPLTLQSYRAYTGTEETLLMPAGALDFVLLYYNKGLFDRFGVAPPEQAMTWEDVYQLARTMTRVEDGVQYRGLDIQDNTLITYNQLSLSFVDPGTNKAAVNNDGWARWFNTMKSFYEIPGNLNEATMTNIGAKIDELSKSQTLAMLVVGPIIGRLGPIERETGLEWDVVSMPYFSGQDAVSTQASAPFLAVSKTSKHQEQAFLAVEAVLSDENLVYRAENIGLTVSADPEINKKFAENNEDLKGKNVAALLDYKVAAPQEVFTKYDSIVQNVLINKFREMVTTGKDSNTILREAEELANQRIEDAMK